MTEDEWLTCEDPRTLAYSRIATSDRKWRLVLCACCRRVWKRMVDDRSRRAVELSERFADGLISEEELAAAGVAAEVAWRELHNKYGGSSQCAAAAASVYSSGPGVPVNGRCNAMGAVTEGFSKAARRRTEQGVQVQIIRDIFGNPFRPIAFDPAWRSEAAVGIARGIYDDRAFERMPILADALQDAGCEHPDILSHCREPGTHVRGCWVVDLVLGKE